jgi:hypothetical protein
MNTTELIEFLKHNDVTEDQLYNLLTGDLYTCPKITPESIDNPVAQQLIVFFMYQIQAVIFPVIRDLRTVLAQVQTAGQIFKDELDKRDEAQISQP